MAARRRSAPSRSRPGASEQASASAASGLEDTPRERIAQESRADLRRLSEPLPHGLGERRQKTRTRQAGGAAATAGGKEATEEVVAGGRQARPQTDQPRRRVAHGVEAPGLHAAAEIERRLRQPLAHRAQTAAPGQQRRDAQVGRRALLQRFSCATPARQPSSSPRSGGAVGAASRRAAAQSTRKGVRPADRSSAISSTAKTPPSPAANPSEEKSSTEARRTPRGRVVGLGAEQGQKFAVRRAEVQGGVKDAVNAHRKFAARDIRSQRRGPPDSVSRRSHGRSREPP